MRRSHVDKRSKHNVPRQSVADVGMHKDAKMPKENVTITMQLHHKTEKAILVSDDGEKNNAVWLPLSQCEFTILKGNTVEVEMPEWLAIEKELV